MKLLKPCSLPRTESIEKDFEAGCLAEGSVIVYVWRQRDTEVVAESIQASGVPGGVVCYHGGMDSGSRANAYSKVCDTKSRVGNVFFFTIYLLLTKFLKSQFMRGKARICVATVAFGLGVNKADIKGVVHMYLPASPEHFLQEIGRAGRDGRQAKAVALVVKEEVVIRHSQAHADLISKSQLKTIFLQFRDQVKAIIDSLSCNHWSDVPAIGIPIPLEKFSSLSDCKEGTIETIFSLLELREGGAAPYLQVEGTTIDQITVSLKRRTLEKLSEKESVMKCIANCAVCVDPPVGEKAPEPDSIEDVFGDVKENSRQRQFVAYSFGSYRFSVTECSNLLGPSAQPRHVFAALRRLSSMGEVELLFDKTSAGRALRIILNNEGLGLFLDESGSSNYIETLVNEIGDQLASIAAVSASKVLDMNYIMHEVAKVAIDSAGSSKSTTDGSKTASLKRFQQLSKKYFDCSEDERLFVESPEVMQVFVQEFSEKEILIDSLSIISQFGTGTKIPNGGNLRLGDAETLDYTALAVTKFLHGMTTVRFPFSLAYQNPLFGKWKAIRFDKLLATVEKLLKSQST